MNPMAWQFEIEGMTHTAQTRDELVENVREMHPETSEDEILNGAEEVPDDQEDTESTEGIGEEGLGQA